jgi:DNA repair exonuclease SbcCD nuclease subunit
MILNTDQLRTLGDVHLGKHFSTGVPMHRRGEREEMVWEQFENELMVPHTKVMVQPGDLFNEFAVPEAVVLRAAGIVKRAAWKNPDTLYIFYRGNHDASRDKDKNSSFDVFQELLMLVPNVLVLTEVVLYPHDGKLYGFMPWHPFKSSTELAMQLLDMMKEGEQLDAAFCHCEIKSYGGTDDNLIPIPVLKHRTKLVYTGHIHQPQTFEQDGVEVVVTGSMQPYAHGEDLEDKWYKTVTFADMLLNPAAPECFKNVNLRVLVADGEVPPEIDCLSLTTKKVTQVEEGEVEEVQLESFDMNALFRMTLIEHAVGQVVSDKILNKFAERQHG